MFPQLYYYRTGKPLTSPSMPSVLLDGWHPFKRADNVMAGVGISAKITSPLPVTDTCLPVCRALARRTRRHWRAAFPHSAPS